MNVKMVIANVLRRLFIRKNTLWYRIFGGLWKEEILSENLKKVKYGSNDADKVYMVIQKNAHTNSGIFEDYIMFMLAIDFALARGYIPVIDRLNYPGYIQQEEEDWYKKNAWEYYFEQPFNVGIEYIESGAANVIMCNSEITFNTLAVLPDNAFLFFRQLALPRNETEQHFSEHFRFIANSYLRFNEFARDFIQQKAREVFGAQNLKDVMAISLREEMFYRREATGLDCSRIEEELKVYQEKWGYKKVFVSTEFDERIQKIEKIFGQGNVFYIKRKRAYNVDNEDVQACIKWKDYSIEGTKAVMEIDRKIYGDKAEKWLNYLAEIYCVSICDGALLQVSSGNIAATVMRSGPWNSVAILQEDNIYE